MEPENNVEVNLETVLGVMEQDPEFRASIQQAVINKDVVASFLETPEGEAIVAPMKDAFATKAIEGFKTKTMPNIIAEEVAKLTPAETPEQKQLKAVQAQLSEIQREKDLLEMRGIATDALSSVGLPSTFASYIISESPEATRHRAQELDVEIQSIVAKHVESKIGAAVTTPTNSEAGVDTNSGKGYYDYTAAELATLYNTNRSEFNRLKAAAKR